MKFTKREERNIKHRFGLVQNLLSINKIYEDKNIIPKLARKNLILYGIQAGRIIEIVYRKINFNKEENNLNSDEIILEMFGAKFFRWISEDHKEFVNGIPTNASGRNNNNINNNNSSDKNEQTD